MNTGILQKCLDELSKEAPRLDYVRGILETLIDSQDNVVMVQGSKAVVGKEYVADTLPPLPDLNKIKAAAMNEMV